MIRLQLNKKRKLTVKMRKLVKKRDAIRRELAFHTIDMKGYGKRLLRFTKKQSVYEFYKVMSSLRRAQKFLDEVANLKFDAHLRNFGTDFEQAKKHIKSCYYQKREVKLKAAKYKRLFDLPYDKIHGCGIDYEKLFGHRDQYKQRYKTLK